MSNHLAIATVSAVLRNTLQKALDAAFPTIPGARATTTRPNAPAADLPHPGVNIFLYQTTLSEGLRNLDLPRRRSDMTLVQRPVVALDLHYLFTFHGVEERLEPEIMLGIATRALHEQPVMTRAAIASAVDGAAYEFLQASDLLDALERTRVALVGLSLDELGRLWSIFIRFRMCFRLHIGRRWCCSRVTVCPSARCPSAWRRSGCRRRAGRASIES